MQFLLKGGWEVEFSRGIDVHTFFNDNDRVRMLNLLDSIYFLNFRYGNLVPALSGVR